MTVSWSTFYDNFKFLSLVEGDLAKKINDETSIGVAGAQ